MAAINQRIWSDRSLRHYVISYLKYDLGYGTHQAVAFDSGQPLAIRPLRQWTLTYVVIVQTVPLNEKHRNAHVLQHNCNTNEYESICMRITSCLCSTIDDIRDFLERSDGI